MSSFKVLSLAAVSALTLSACAQIEDSQKHPAEVALNSWIAAMESGNTDNVLKQYDEDSVLLATFAKKPLTTQEERKKYFDGLLKKKDLKIKVDELHTDHDGEIATANGLYTFSYKEGKKTVKVPARFTFVFEDEGKDGWEIESHHSSVLPK